MGFFVCLLFVCFFFFFFFLLVLGGSHEVFCEFSSEMFGFSAGTHSAEEESTIRLVA